jgi:hypothetical protein
MPFDIWKLVHGTVKIRNAGQQPVSESSSGGARTHPSLRRCLRLSPCGLADALTLEDTEYETLAPIALENRFVCKDGVEARRLLVITRNDLLRDVKELYDAEAICDEAWRIRIFRRQKGSLYSVYVSKGCSLDNIALISVLSGSLPGSCRQTREASRSQPASLP